jgi:hypothetical protein
MIFHIERLSTVPLLALDLPLSARHAALVDPKRRTRAQPVDSCKELEGAKGCREFETG